MNEEDKGTVIRGGVSLFILISIVGGLIFLIEESERRQDPKDGFKAVHIQACIDGCIENEFRMFHNSESQFLGGAASSSMNGLKQEAIYDKVQDRCRDQLLGKICIRGE